MAASKKKRLGRGLSAILEDVELAYKQGIEDQEDKIKEIPLDSITPNPYQPRKRFDEEALRELSASLKQHGLLQPIIVVERDDGYMLIAGERRYRAAKLAGFDSIKAIVTNFENKNLRELALIENIQREDLNPIELAKSYKELIQEHNITQEELSNIIQKSRTQITNTLRLLTLSNETIKLIEEGKISQGHAKVLVGLDKETQKIVTDTIIGQKLSVRETEKLVQSIKNQKEPPSKIDKKLRLNRKLLKKGVEALKNRGFRAKVSQNKITISFEKEEELEKFLKFLED
ncbi:MAG: ParB/RepB/Spo0J family partition protein [Epsilonproteobacteria bacterium]|nr:ParB/RepB/Spo0J family partition protein [Campylobacterota bacterium]